MASRQYPAAAKPLLPDRARHLGRSDLCCCGPRRRSCPRRTACAALQLLRLWHPLHPVARLAGAGGLGAVCAAVEAGASLHTMPDDLAPAVFADRRHPVDRALEAVEGVHGPLRVNLERHVVVVPADLALRHGAPSRWALTSVGRGNPMADDQTTG